MAGPLSTTWRTDRAPGRGSPPMRLAGPAECSQIQLHQNLKRGLGVPDSVCAFPLFVSPRNFSGLLCLF